MYQLSAIEKRRLLAGIQAAYAIPFIHDVTDFIWEAIFAYMKNVPIQDPLTNVRKKLLYDVVDIPSKIGWSAKAIQKSLNVPMAVELVIQRADIFKKAPVLGFDVLNLDSPTQMLGEALLRHWYAKIEEDAITQNVKEKRLCILLKSLDMRKYIYFEDNLAQYSLQDLNWRWTDTSRTGLQGIRKADGFIVFRWYPNQKQLFERFQIPSHAFTFELEPQRLPVSEVVDLLLDSLSNSRYS